MKTFRFRKKRKMSVFPSVDRPTISKGDSVEMLSGQVQGFPASAGEERMAKALDKKGIEYRFRYSVGAPRGLPGWKELDFLVVNKGIVYALEVDTAFTHRSKAVADVLHDAIIQNDRNIQTLGTLWPSVLHADGNSDLASQENATKYVERAFGR